VRQDAEIFIFVKFCFVACGAAKNLSTLLLCDFSPYTDDFARAPRG
jgi:hypothetical protein